MDRCAQCGFDRDAPVPDGIATSIVAGAGELAGILREPGHDLARRRSPGQWSPLEYGCHLRDVLLVQRERVLLARRRDLPALEPMGRDERVAHDGYAEQQPALVADELTMAARLFANVLDRLGPRDWDRLVGYNYPQPAERTLRWVAANTLHEVRHHLLDVRGQLAS